MWWQLKALRLPGAALSLLVSFAVNFPAHVQNQSFGQKANKNVRYQGLSNGLMRASAQPCTGVSLVSEQE